MGDTADWERDTQHLRDWVTGSGAPTEALRRELATWLVRKSDSAASAVEALAAALTEGDQP